MVGILLLLVVLAYAGAVDEHGTERQAAFWGNRTTELDRAANADLVLTPQTVERFGVRMGVQK